MVYVVLCCPGWSSGPVLWADTFRRRWRGLRPRPNGHGLLLPGSSAHGVGMAEPLLVVGVSAEHRVVAVRTLRPGRMVWARGARFLIELPADHPPPPVGARVEIVRRT
ncbi:MAG: hypothetical protein ACRDVM_08840 [Acidimicrobiia bacterium]